MSETIEQLAQEVQRLRDLLKKAEDKLINAQQAEYDKASAKYSAELEERRQAYLKKNHNVDFSEAVAEDLDLDNLPIIISNEYVTCDLNKIKTQLQNLPKDHILYAHFDTNGKIKTSTYRTAEHTEIFDERFNRTGFTFSRLTGALRIRTYGKAKLIPMELTKLTKGEPYDIDLNNLPEVTIGLKDHKIKLDNYKNEIGQLKPGEHLSFGRDPGKDGIEISSADDVSRSHFDIKNENGKLVLVDNSTNGTRMRLPAKKEPNKTIVNMTTGFFNKIRTGRW
jgi:hypothetical protein